MTKETRVDRLVEVKMKDGKRHAGRVVLEDERHLLLDVSRLYQAEILDLDLQQIKAIKG